ncbi:MAG: hypothetical protein AAGE89_01615 [Pseudomonadota bacterium]
MTNNKPDGTEQDEINALVRAASGVDVDEAKLTRNVLTKIAVETNGKSSAFYGGFRSYSPAAACAGFAMLMLGAGFFGYVLGDIMGFAGDDQFLLLALSDPHGLNDPFLDPVFERVE